MTMRSMAVGVLALVAVAMAEGPAAGQQARTTAEGHRPASTTWLGDTGLWFVPTAEILPAGSVSISGYRTDIDREQGQSDIAHFLGTVGVGIGDRLEIFGSVRADTRIRRDARPLFDPDDPNFGGVLQDYPGVTDFWNGDDAGDVIIGAKINLLSEHRRQPAAVAVRGMVKAPTGDEDAGKSTGEVDVMADLVVSKQVNDVVELAGFGGVLVRGEPSGIQLGNSIRWGVGAGFPTRSRVRLVAELHGEVPMDDAVVLSSPLTGIDGSISPLISRIAAPTDLNLGLQYQARRGIFLGAGVSYAVGQKKFGGGGTAPLIGWQFRIGYHPGVRVYVPPAPPAPAPTPAPPANRPPTVTLSCDPCDVMVGEVSQLRADARDPDGDTLAYRWNTPAGTLQDAENRAASVRDYLVSQGIATGRLTSVGYGEERPAHDNLREETRRLNRRAALVVRVQ